MELHPRSVFVVALPSCVPAPSVPHCGELRGALNFWPEQRPSGPKLRKMPVHTYFLLPPLRKPSGGMAVLAQLAAHVREAGFAVSFVVNGELPPGLQTHPDIPVQHLKTAVPREADRWVVPEGWPALLAPGLQSRCRCAVYVQNWAFVHGILPENVEWQDLGLRMFSVSRPVSLFLEATLGLRTPIVRPAIAPNIFSPPHELRGAPANELRIAWMPRKNKHLAIQIRRIFEALAARAGQKPPVWLPIENLPPEGVAEALRRADVFLATGFPEGFGLPPLEAMSCGCLVAGFTGMGGWDYMRQALPAGFVPSFPLPETPWRGNGFFAADGDVWGAAVALQAACECLRAGSAPGIVEAGHRAASWYSPGRQRQEVLRLWQDEDYWK